MFIDYRDCGLLVSLVRLSPCYYNDVLNINVFKHKLAL